MEITGDYKFVQVLLNRLLNLYKNMLNNENNLTYSIQIDLFQTNLKFANFFKKLFFFFKSNFQKYKNYVNLSPLIKKIAFH